jgi:hypothetical protein
MLHKQGKSKEIQTCLIVKMLIEIHGVLFTEEIYRIGQESVFTWK